eukprot:TRINITY_DN4005_c0_g1_i1.p1 TRINITY_DN4005_c0_g1~~TRINITY_DN4005_c0_g1_i1.p1  ORF type:complete len:761 (-),score=268.83 TRINITY_DN4005_c0_g1_i1:288-2570(-)
MSFESEVKPSLSDIQAEFSQLTSEGANIIPLVYSVKSTLPDPTITFLKVRRDGTESFLLESAEAVLHSKGKANMVYSVVATDPWNKLVVVENPKEGQLGGDPVSHIQNAVGHLKSAKKYSLSPDVLNGAALGYISYDCVRFFEPKVSSNYPLEDVLQLPESVMVFCNSFVYYDHQNASNNKLVVLCPLPKDQSQLEENYRKTLKKLEELKNQVENSENPEEPKNSPPVDGQGKGVSNIGQEGYEGFVRKLKERIVDGDIIQCVPSHRIRRPTGIHPFNIYRELRRVNPSRYMFFADFLDFQLIGASPELLVKVTDGVVINHPIAGTRHRGADIESDEALATELLGDEKERAEHIMLVDLGRNDVNRVSEPTSTKVTDLMRIERYSHVMHIVSEVKGTLRAGFSPSDAFRSIFPAGTVSGAPKIKAMELISKLEKQKRGIYAGAFGAFAFNGNIDTCITLRTMVLKDQVAWLQAGGGIVFDSEPYPEYMETVNKMAALARAIDEAESIEKPTGSLGASGTGSKPHRTDSEWSSLWNSFQNASKQSEKRENKEQVKKSGEGEKGKGKILMIDNYDSFTYNLYQYLCQLGEEVIVYRNDAITVEQCLELKPDRVVISPGPSWPKDAGISSDVIRAFAGRVPVLGVCLGHECMAEVFGGTIEHCGEVVHGKTSELKHDGKGLYKGLPQGVEVIRYHSLAAPVKSIDGTQLEATSFTDNGIIMGLRHKEFTIEGLQFHPESIKTDRGMQMLQNFLNMKGGKWSDS